MGFVKGATITGVKMAKILVGTCGYDDNEWVGPVYPEGTKSAVRSPFYSRLFRTLELDHTYYGIPKASNLEKMLITRGPDLAFAINAYRQQRKIFTEIPKVKTILLHHLPYQ
jgi:hypothetical protein